ncbi:MAG TPA: hypothetical protein PKN80_03290 [bacterium]|uniref:Uncharacterized protein n=1 Tax=candidate division TA06 bacterium ADurb.Bin417 TaxID=1852828 RepID=A0A1V5M8K4_UNCT6|nr:MAG: hypothetical protein BWY73_01499 [candidate division TA06 bacterium ADurb.Bin417]HNQ35069.1 hypothetical protein [bacterium]HNS49362.1 hypothetical protein [bacterium]
MRNASQAIWLWSHVENLDWSKWGLDRTSRITPAAAAEFLGIENLLLVTYADQPAPPFREYAAGLAGLKQVVWSALGAANCRRGSDLSAVLELVPEMKNLTGVILDDFFNRRDRDGNPGTYTRAELMEMRRRLAATGRPLELWGVLYNHQLELPVAEKISAWDAVTFWHWTAEELERLETTLPRFEKLAAGRRKLLGLYMYDFGNRRPLPLSLMERQCRIGRDLLAAGRIDGLIFLSSILGDQNLEAVEFTRGFVKENFRP